MKVCVDCGCEIRIDRELYSKGTPMVKCFYCADCDRYKGEYYVELLICNECDSVLDEEDPVDGAYYCEECEEYIKDYDIEDE